MVISKKHFVRLEFFDQGLDWLLAARLYVKNAYLKLVNISGFIKFTSQDLNEVISLAMSGTTSMLRYPGNQATDLRKMFTSMIQYPRLHFLISSVAPITPKIQRDMVRAFEHSTFKHLNI